MTSLDPALVLNLLLADESNPRSVAFQLVRLTEHAESLPHGAAANPTAVRTREERLLLRALTDLRLADMHHETKPDPLKPDPAKTTSASPSTPPREAQRRDHLHKTLTTFIHDLRALSDILSQNYLSHALASRQLASSPAPEQ